MITTVNAYYPDRATALVPAFGGSSYGTSTVARVFMGSGGGSGGQVGNDTGDGNYMGVWVARASGILVCLCGITSRWTMDRLVRPAQNGTKAGYVAVVNSMREGAARGGSVYRSGT